MNINNLEMLARQANNGDIAEKSNEMLKKGEITNAEHRSVNSQSWQVASNVEAGNEGIRVASLGNVGSWV